MKSKKKLLSLTLTGILLICNITPVMANVSNAYGTDAIKVRSETAQTNVAASNNKMRAIADSYSLEEYKEQLGAIGYELYGLITIHHS